MKLNEQLEIPTSIRYETIYAFKSLQPFFVRSTVQNNERMYNPKLFEKEKSGNLSHSIRCRVITAKLLRCKSNKEMIKQLHELDQTNKKEVQRRSCTTVRLNKKRSSGSLNPKGSSFTNKLIESCNLNSVISTKNKEINISSKLNKNTTQCLPRAVELPKFKKDRKENLVSTTTNQRSFILGKILIYFHSEM